MSPGAAPAYTLVDLVAGLDLAAAGPNLFTGRAPRAGWRRVFGGLIVAQALVAMARTAGGRPVHALHGTFVRPGDPGEPLAYEVAPLRDGGSFTARNCTAGQLGLPIFAATASFQAPEPDGYGHAMPMPEAPAPDHLPDPADPGTEGVPPAVRSYFARNAAVEIRRAEPDRAARAAGSGAPGRRMTWMRAAGALPDDPALHAAVLAYMSDLTLLDTALMPHDRSVFDPDIQAASLDHAVWFHRPARADGWLLYVEDSPTAAGGRGFARGSVFDRTGRLVASTAQEGLIRRRTDGRERPVLPKK